MKGLQFLSVIFLLFCLSACLISDSRGADTEQIQTEEQSGTGAVLNSLQNFGKYLGEGVLYSRYKKPGWREYVMPDRLELTRRSPAQLSPHPRLLTPYQINLIKIRKNKAPYDRWYRLVRQKADQPVLPRYDRVTEITRQAESSALLYRLEKDPIYLRKTMDLLEKLPEPPEIADLEGGKPNSGWGDYLQSAEAVPSLCVTYDLLQEELPPRMRVDTERKVLVVVEQLVNAFKITPRNNHVTVMAIAVCTSALTFDNIGEYLYYSQDDLFRTGIDQLSQSLGLVAPDGGYGEGPYYAHYILGYLAPFSVHLANTMNIRLFAHPWLERMVNWVLDNEKGSGQYTQFDDSYEIRNFYLPLIVSQANSGIYWNAWLDSRPEFPHYNGNMIEALAAYRELPVGNFRSPFFPGKFYADMGQVILKDRQIAPGFFVSLVAERERWFADVHEQIDPFSFELSALGEDWIIDGGYGGGTGDPNRDYFISPQANSTVLVDGYGTDPNPLVGDEPGGRLDYGFSTPQFAAAGCSHVIGDVYLTRHLFYSGGNHVIVWDQMDGGTPHFYTVQYNYLGNFEDQGNGKVRIGKNGKQLNIHLLADDVADWRVRQNRGLATGRQGVFGHSVVQFESETQPNANLASLWIAGEDADFTAAENLPLASGNGEWRQIRDFKNNVVEDIVWSRSGMAATPVWQADARLTWAKYRSPADPEAVLLLEGTTFRQGELQIRTSIPVILYLERQGDSWAGYVSFNPAAGPLVLETAGVSASPFRLNGILQNAVSSENKTVFEISGPGILFFGTGQILIHQPQQFLGEPDFLEWLASATETARDPAVWSDYQMTLFKNQVTRNLIWGTEQTFSFWGEKYTGNPFLIRNAANAVQGLLEYNYRSSLSGEGILLPHRYGFKRDIGDTRLAISEEGNWRSSGPQVRDLWIRGEKNQSAAVSYRFRHFYDQYYSHEFFAGLNRQIGADVRWIQTEEAQLQDYRLFFSQPAWDVSPRVQFRQQTLSSLGLDANASRVRTSFRADGLESRPSYYQYLTGYLPGRGNWLVEGEQFPDENLQNYRTAFSGSFWKTGLFSMGMTASRRNRWNFSEGRFAVSRYEGSYQFYQITNYLESEWYWNVGLSRSAAGGFWSGNLYLKNWSFGKTGLADFAFSRRILSRGLWNSRLNFKFDQIYDSYRLALNQQWYLPVHKEIGLSPLWNFEIGQGIETASLGGGISLERLWPVYLQFLQFRNAHPFAYNFEWGFPLPFIGGNPLNVSGTLLWASELLQYGEVRVQQMSGSVLSPGIYYRYLRPREQRLEGYLQWRW